jgi:hypothetical protein
MLEAVRSEPQATGCEANAEATNSLGSGGSSNGPFGVRIKVIYLMRCSEASIIFHFSWLGCRILMTKTSSLYKDLWQIRYHVWGCLSPYQGTIRAIDLATLIARGINPCSPRDALGMGVMLDGAHFAGQPCPSCSSGIEWIRRISNPMSNRNPFGSCHACVSDL